MTKVGLGGFLHTVCTTAVVNGVEVVTQNLLLGLGLVNLDRQESLLELTHVRVGGVYVVVLHVLLGQGRGTLNRPTG